MSSFVGVPNFHYGFVEFLRNTKLIEYLCRDLTTKVTFNLLTRHIEGGVLLTEHKSLKLYVSEVLSNQAIQSHVLILRILLDVCLHMSDLQVGNILNEISLINTSG